MAQNYTLEWLDSQISIVLSPHKMYFQDISKDELQAMSEKATIETIAIQSELRNQVFSLHKENQIKLLVRKYHSALIILLDTITEHQKHPAFIQADLLNIAATLISCLDELLTFIEKRFSNFLSLEERVPSTYLAVSCNELKIKLDRLKKRLVANVADTRFTDLVLGNLYGFINSKKNARVTFREMLYRKELVKELELVGEKKNQTSVYAALHELLVYMNFNSRSYMNYFTQCIADKINLLQNKVERIDSLNFHYKEFQQMHSNQNMVLYPHHDNLKDVLNNWFSQEIAYLEKTLHLAVSPLSEHRAPAAVPVKDEKIICDLSADQLALILRAADESRVVVAKSMTEVFKSIVPHLSTTRRETLSYTAVRSKAYNAEDRDKEIAVLALQRMTEKIKGY